MVDADVDQVVRHLIDRDAWGMAITVIAGESAGRKAVIDESGRVVAGSLPDHLSDGVRADAGTLMRVEKTVTLGYGSEEVFYEAIAPRPHLFVFGAVHIAQELTAHASLLGFRTVIADPRPAFVTEERFPNVDELRLGWPGEVCESDELDLRTFVVVLTHDRRFEDPLWPIALSSKARYIGAMGSKKTTARRRERLLAEGFSESQIQRIHGPVGLLIGARTAGETAIAIIAEMISVRYAVDHELVLHGVPLRP